MKQPGAAKRRVSNQQAQASANAMRLKRNEIIGKDSYVLDDEIHQLPEAPPPPELPPPPEKELLPPDDQPDEPDEPDELDIEEPKEE